MTSIPSILVDIVAATRGRVAQAREIAPIKRLERSIHFVAPTVSLVKYLKRDDLCGVIAECKRRSPSKGDINPYIKVDELSVGYMQAGASALSILTEPQFFGGSLDDLALARGYNFCPILRKDFIIDEYQLFEARSYGADVVLLIAACLSTGETLSLARRARELGLEVLLEVHDEGEIGHWNEFVDLIGVNNRNLATFQVDVAQSFALKEKLPPGVPAISESGLRTPEVVRELKQAGFSGFLIGEQFMAQPDPAAACRAFISHLKGSRA